MNAQQKPKQYRTSVWGGAAIGFLLFVLWVGMGSQVIESGGERRAVSLLPASPLQNSIVFTDVTTTHLPPSAFAGSSMDVYPVNLDGDQDWDLVIAREFGTNVLLINDGTGHFADESTLRFPQPQPVHDSEDVGVADFDLDLDLDIVFVSEDDQINELYFNDGTGVFTDASDRLPVTGTSNAVLVANVDGDEDMDILIGNDGANVLLINDGKGFFTNESTSRLPPNTETTQDLEVGDVDDDEDLDLLVSNENGNRLWLNDGKGFFTDVTAAQLPLPVSGEESREGDFGDVDGDQDLDIYFANVTFSQGRPRQNRLLLNNGEGFFTDVTAEQLPAESFHTVDGDFYDIDDDGDLDLLLANAFGGNYQIQVNDGDGFFEEATNAFFLTAVVGDGIDVEVADYNGDLLEDIYLSGYQGSDHLLFALKEDGDILGDVTCDGTSNAVDALFILQYAVGTREAADTCPLPASPPERLYEPGCDVSEDNSCNTVDALFVLQCVVGIPNSFCPTGNFIPTQ